MEIKKVGVVGAGIMGAGIVQVSAQMGYQMVVSEVNDELLKKGLGIINAGYTKNVEKEKMSQQDKDAALGRIKGTTNMQDFSDCDVVIEAVVENLDLKKKIFADLDKICRPDAILASNTSCLSIIDMASQTKRPEKVLGLHFFNPVVMMRLLEIVRTIATSDETIAAVKPYGESLGKSMIVAKDTPGFIVNHLLLPFMLDGIRMYENGVASKEDIDAGVHLGLNHPMGPLTLADLTGNDTNLFVADALYEATKDPKFVAPILLRKMVAAGWLGRKSGKGFYDYT